MSALVPVVEDENSKRWGRGKFTTDMCGLITHPRDGVIWLPASSQRDTDCDEASKSAVRLDKVGDRALRSARLTSMSSLQHTERDIVVS